MSTSTRAGRARAPLPRAIEPARFDGYPYPISRIGRCALRHIAVLPADWPRERIVALARAQAQANRLETAACFGPDDAVYAAVDGSRTWKGPTPSGLYVVERLRLAEDFPESEEIEARRSRLRKAARAQGGGYVVGDGAEDRRTAAAADRLRLGGSGRYGLPAGLVRCRACGQAAGDYLIDGSEIVRCRCACENQNRCARCRLPLAAHALSSWFYDEAGGPGYMAAYGGFSHRCPDGSRGEAGA